MFEGAWTQQQPIQLHFGVAFAPACPQAALSGPTQYEIKTSTTGTNSTKSSLKMQPNHF